MSAEDAAAGMAAVRRRRHHAHEDYLRTAQRRMVEQARARERLEERGGQILHRYRAAGATDPA